MLKFNEIYEAYEYANFGGVDDQSAHLNRELGKIVLVPSGLVSDPEEIEAAEKELENGEWIDIPNKHDLGLGKKLVFRFASENLSPADFSRVERFFSHSGAYGNWKDFLAERGLLQKWYDFSFQSEVAALKEWLAQEEIPYEDETGKIIEPPRQ